MQGGSDAVNLAIKAFPVAVRRIEARYAFAHRLAAFTGKHQLALRSAQVGQGDRLEVFIMLQQALEATVNARGERLLVNHRAFTGDQRFVLRVRRGLNLRLQQLRQVPFKLLQLRLRDVLRQVTLQVEHHPRVQEFAVIVLRLIQHLVGFQRFIAVLHVAAVVVAKPGRDVHGDGRQQHLIQRLLVQRLRGIADVIPAVETHAARNRRIVHVKRVAFRQVDQTVQQRQQFEQVALRLVL